MARTSREQQLTDVHRQSLTNFDKVQSSVRDVRKQCLSARRFVGIPGAQWEGPLEDQYANKPKLEVNKTLLSVIRIINEYRNNRVAPNFVPKDGSDDNMADICNGLYRADEQDSVADEAYDNAFDEEVTGGIGAWRLRTEYEDNEDKDNDYQRIRISPIFDADSSVFFDLAAKRQDKADAKECWVISAMGRDAYIEEWGDDPASWPKDIHQSEFDWLTPDVVYVAEYYKVEYQTETIHVYRALDGSEERYSDSDLEDNPDLADTLAAIGSQEIRQRKIKRKRVHKYIMSGAGILEDCGYIAGSCIPIVIVYGKRWYIDNVERCMGHVSIAMDAQRLKNMQISKLAEISALSSVEKPIFYPEEVSGHQVTWARDNLENYPYLQINQMTGADGNPVPRGPIEYTRSPSIPPAMAALLQITEQDMQELLGSSQQADKMVSNISGKAVEMIQQRLDMQTFIYMSNFAKGMKRCGEIWLSMAKEIYADQGRKLKSIAADGTRSMVELVKPTIGKDGKIVMINDISNVKFDVVADVGPSSSSRKAATVRALTGMIAITDDPQTKQVLQAMAITNMEGEGIADVRDYFRKQLLRMGAIKPTEQESQELMAEMQAESQKQDPNAIFLQAAAEEAVAKASKARADTVKTIADAELSRAKTVETLANVDMDTQDHALNLAQEIGGVVTNQTQSANNML